MQQTEIHRDARVVAADGDLGRVAHVVVDQATREVTDLVVEGDGQEWLVPAREIAAIDGGVVRLRGGRATLEWPSARFEQSGFRGVDDERASGESAGRATHGGLPLLGADDDTVAVGTGGTVATPMASSAPSRPAGRDTAGRSGGAVVQATEAVTEGDRRIALLEERLIPSVRAVDLGELRVHKRVESTEERVRQALTREEVEIERVPVNRPLDAPAQNRTEGEWLVVPVMEEVLVVQKRLMLKEELRIRRRTVVVEQEVRETVRHERLELEDATRHGVRGLPGAGAAAGIAGAGGSPAGQ